MTTAPKITPSNLAFCRFVTRAKTTERHATIHFTFGGKAVVV